MFATLRRQTAEQGLIEAALSNIKEASEFCLEEMREVGEAPPVPCASLVGTVVVEQRVWRCRLFLVYRYGKR